MESEPMSYPLLHAEDAVRRAEESVERESPDTSLQLLNELQRQFPREARLCWLAAELLEETGNVDAAVTCYGRTLSLDPENAECALDLAELFLREDRLEEAERILTGVLLRLPDNPRATAMLGVLLWSRGDASGSEAALRMSLELDPRYSWAARYLCDLLQELGRLEEAHELVLGMLDRDPVDPYNHAYLGDLLLDLGRCGDAESAFRTALWLWPGYSWAARKLAQLLCHSGRADEARQVLRESLKVAPDDAWTLACLGCVEKRRGDRPEAEESFRRALMMEPGLDVAYDGLLELLVQAERLNEAQELFRARPNESGN